MISGDDDDDDNDDDGISKNPPTTNWIVQIVPFWRCIQQSNYYVSKWLVMDSLVIHW